MRFGVLTGGGDCPGLNAVIRAVVRKGEKEYGYEFIGFRDGWKGPLEGLTMPLNIAATRGILPRGGTILGSSRTNPFKIENGVEKGKRSSANNRHPLGHRNVFNYWKIKHVNYFSVEPSSVRLIRKNCSYLPVTIIKNYAIKNRIYNIS